jgi:multidrug efflux pump subunit AcrB
MALSSKGLSEQKIFDLGQNFIRRRWHRCRARRSFALWRARTPDPDRSRPAALVARHLSATDVGLALAAQNQIVPAGTAKIGQYEYNIRLNNSPEVVDQLNNLPIRTVDGTTVYMRDVAHVRDGSPPQRNEVRVDGGRAVLMTILKSGSASTIAIVDQVKALLPKLKETLPADLKVQLLSDQSLFVKAAVSGVVREGVIAAALPR